MPASQINKELAGRFRDAATIVDLKGENAFKAIAFRRVAALLENLPEDVRALHAAGGRKAIEAVEGIGRSSAAIIVDVIESGTSPDHDELAASVPPELLLMLDVPGLGPKTVRLLWRERGIETLAALAAAIDDGSLAGLRGLGPKRLAQIGEGLALREAAARRRTLGEAIKTARPLLEGLAAIDGVERVEQAGSVRRGCETVGDLDVLLTIAPGADAAAILEAFGTFPRVERVLGLDDTRCRVLTDDDLRIDCRVVPPASFGAALCRFTGSEAHERRLRSLARAHGLHLDEQGLFDAAAWDARGGEPGDGPGDGPGGPPTLEPVAGRTEEEIYARLGLAWVPPEMREDSGEIELALRDDLPALIEAGDIRGDLHCHTRASDGVGSIEEMAEAAKALGHRFLAITDHSPSQGQANGLDAARLAAHAAAIRTANGRIDGIELLAGTECDILADGRLDYDDAVLAELDWVIASPHAALRQDGGRATERLLRAIDNPYVNAIGHPTGRLVNARAGLPLDFAAVFAAAAASGTALEINASYRRLDLAAERARAAVRAGCTLTINTDAHTPHGLGRLDGGLATARRGWVTRADVLNCMTLAELRRFVARKRG